MEKLTAPIRSEDKDSHTQIQTHKQTFPRDCRPKQGTVPDAIQEPQMDLQEYELGAAITTPIPVRNERNQPSQEGTAPRISKAARRRAKTAASARALAAAVEHEKSQYHTSSRGIEFSKLEATLRERGLALFKVPSDGDCLYASVAHQLKIRSLLPSLADACSRLNISPSMAGNGESVKLMLRLLTSAFIRQEPDEFLPFITSEDNSPDSLISYCKQIEKPGVWGGQLELRAISSALSIPIEVLQADVPAMKIGDNFSQSPLILTYHHHAYSYGEHYNSSIPINFE